jgi:hypothetical protein
LNVGSVPQKKKFRCTKWFAARVIITIALIGLLFCIAFFLIPSAPVSEGIAPPDLAQIVFLNIITVSEAAVTAAGITFMIHYGRFLTNAPPKMKKKVIIVYICICWYMVHWFPHTQLHRYFGLALNPLIGLEMSFHWVNLAALSVLAYYQFSIMLLCMALTKTKMNLARLEKGESIKDVLGPETPKPKSPAKRFFGNVKVQAVAIVICFFIVLFFGVRRVFPTPGQPNEVQSALITTIEVVAAITFGVGAAFAILMGIRIANRIAPRYQKAAWCSYAAILYIFLTDYFHAKTHFAISEGDWWGLIILEIFFHIGVTGAAFILIHYQKQVIKVGQRLAREHTSSTTTTRKSGVGSSTEKDERSSTIDSGNDEESAGEVNLQSPITISTTRSPATQDVILKTSSKENLKDSDSDDESSEDSASIIEEIVRAELQEPSITTANPLVNESEKSENESPREDKESENTTTDEKTSGSDLISRSNENEESESSSSSSSSDLPSKSESESQLEASSSSE